MTTHVVCSTPAVLPPSQICRILSESADPHGLNDASNGPRASTRTNAAAHLPTLVDARHAALLAVRASTEAWLSVNRGRSAADDQLNDQEGPPLSAWIVNRDHLDLLLTAAVGWKLTKPEQSDETGRMLWRENLASVAYRYPGDHDGERPGPDDFRDRNVHTYRFRPYPGRVDPEVVATAATSLAYQSCEHPGWQASAACQWVTRMREQADARIDAYRAEYGPVDPDRQACGERGWYVLIDIHGNRCVRSSDGWDVSDRGVFTRAAALRATPTQPPGVTGTPERGTL
jgi:hypothetical protein